MDLFFQPRSLVVSNTNQILSLTMQSMLWTKNTYEPNSIDRRNRLDTASPSPIDGRSMGYQTDPLALDRLSLSRQQNVQTTS
jgi:hypothetical protein